ncbi:MAG: hypothetical protein ACR2J8_01840 [Thermomicrobiales bacterium]
MAVDREPETEAATGEVQRERLLLAGTVAVAVIAPALIWKIGRSTPLVAEAPADQDRERQNAQATRAASAAATPAAKKGAGKADKNQDAATPEPKKEKAKGASGKKARRDPGTPTAEP